MVVGIDNPSLDAFRQLTARVVITTNSVLALDAGVYLDTRPEAIRTAAAQWKPIPDVLARIDATFKQLARDVLTVGEQSDHTGDRRGRDIKALGDAAEAVVAADAKTVETTSRKVLDSLRSAAYPARPATDAAQEIAVQGIKNDLTMVLAPIRGKALIERLEEHLVRSIADRDALKTWVLASTRWPEDYLVSRGEGDTLGALWNVTVTGILDDHAPDEIAEARRVYQTVSNPQSGLPVLPVLFMHTVPKIVPNIVRDAQYLTR